MENQDDVPVYVVAGKEDGEQRLTVNEVETRLIARLAETARAYVGVTPDAYCLSVPIYFSEKQKEALLAAAKEAEVPVAGLISEPVAACLAYHSKLSMAEQKKLNQLDLVVDLGASGLAVTVVSVTKGLYTILGSHRDVTVSGNAFDEVLVKHMAGEFTKKTGLNALENPKAKEKLRHGCEITKKSLSSATMATCSVESLMHGRDLNQGVNRMRFEMLAKPLFAKILDTIKAVLQQLSIEAGHVDEIILAGGSSRFPKMKNQISSMCPNAKVRSEIDPDEAIARGCAIQARIYQEKGNEFNKVEASHLAKSIGIVDAEGKFHRVLRQHSALPLSETVKAKNTKDQCSVCVEIWEGEPDWTLEGETITQERKKLCELVLSDLKGEEDLEIIFKADSALEITLRDVSSGKSSTIQC